MTLNRAQRIIVKISACIVLFGLLFPPWAEKRGERTGRYFIFYPPGDVWIGVDAALLFFQIAAVVTGTALLVWWFDSHQAITQSPPKKTSERGIVQRFRGLRGPLRFLWLVALLFGLLRFFSVMFSNP